MAAQYHSPIGWLEVKASSKGITSLRKVESPENPGPGNELEKSCITQLKEYFDGRRKNFDLPFDWTGKPAYHKLVWKELLKIPFGRTLSYGSIAESLGDANASRAVGMANRMNPIAIIVPCHRVLAKNGDLHGYFYGLETKRFLLQLENPKSYAIQGSLF